MEDTQLDGVCAALDLVAQLEGQLERSQQRLRACELEALQLILGSEADPPVLPPELIAQARHHRAEVAALRHVLADLRGEGGRDVACA